MHVLKKCTYHHGPSQVSLVVVVVAVLWQCLACAIASPWSSDESSSSAERNGGAVWVDFAHEKCQKDVLTTNQYKTFYHAKPFFLPDGVFELLVRFKGIADGHVILTTNATSEEPRYTISLGSYNNRFSEIRRIKPNKIETKISTPSIMSDLQFRGFIIRYDPHQGHISVFGEGSDVALLHVEDTNEPLTVNYFSFATWHNRIVQVAFNCLPKDSHSTADIRSLVMIGYSLAYYIGEFAWYCLCLAFVATLFLYRRMFRDMHRSS